jgi:uncharacterized protein YdaU (DUF1376 family)
MSKAPAMPMYWDAYLADTTHLTTEEHGAYMLLLAAMWRRNGSVPDDDKDNARILGLTNAKWRKIKARFIATISGFRVENDAITQEKLQKTWEITQEKIDKNRSNGAKGGRASASKNNDLDQANATNSQERKDTIPEPEPEPDIKKGTSYPRAQAESDLSTVVDSQTAKDFVEHRFAMKKPITKLAVQKMIKQLQSHSDPKAVLDASVMNGWQGIFPDKIRTNGHDKQNAEFEALLNVGREWDSKRRMDSRADQNTVIPLLPARLAGSGNSGGND